MDSTNINDILKLIDNENAKLESQIYIPSLDANVKVKAMTAKHSKDILKSVIDGAFSSTQFNLVIHDILNDILDKSIKSSQINSDTVSLKDISVYDKPFILMQLRMLNIGDSVKVKLRNDNGDEIDHTVFLPKFLEKKIKNRVGLRDNVKITDDNNFEVYLNFPSIEDEFQFENYIYRTKMMKITNKDVNLLKELFEPIISNNTTQYIKLISINGTSYDISTRKLEDRLSVEKRLNAKLLERIIKTINDEFASVLNEITLIEITKDGLKYKGNIEIDADFFTN
jgi:hypothetical protein